MKKELGFLSKINKVEAVFLFGSYARGDQNSLSDVDICIIGDVSLKDRKKIRHNLPENFDVSFFNELPIWIKMRVFREGKLIFARDKKKLKDLTFRTLKEYLDFQPVIKSFIKEKFEDA